MTYPRCGACRDLSSAHTFAGDCQYRVQAPKPADDSTRRPTTAQVSCYEDLARHANFAECTLSGPLSDADRETLRHAVTITRAYLPLVTTSEAWIDSAMAHLSESVPLVQSIARRGGAARGAERKKLERIASELDRAGDLIDDDGAHTPWIRRVMDDAREAIRGALA